MAAVIRRLKRSNKKATKFQFTVALQELLLCVEESAPRPEKVVLSFLHRRRKVSSKERQWEPSFSKPEQTVIVWPEQAPEYVEILTTLYKGSADETYEDKEWTVVVEELSPKGRRRPIAAVPLNMRLFVLDAPDQRSQLKLKLRPLIPTLKQGSLVFLLSSQQLRDVAPDEMSVASSASLAGPVSREQSIHSFHDVKESSPGNSLVTGEITTVAASIEQWNSNLTKVDEERSVPSKIEPLPSPVPPITPNVRPPWRISVEEHTDSAPVSQKRADSVAVETVFEVNAKSQPVAVPIPPHIPSQPAPSPRIIRSHSPRAPSRDRAPEQKDGESNIDWARRVTQGYDGVKISSDFKKSWQNGLALCAILHAYRPDLLDYSTLDISETATGRKGNINKALDTLTALGITDKPELHDILTPDRQIILSLLSRVKRVLEGVPDLPSPDKRLSASDHWISKVIPVSASEQQVIDEINRIKEQREAEEAVDYSAVPDDNAHGPSVTTDAYDLMSSFDTPRSSTVRSSGRDDLRRRARQMLENTSATSSPLVATATPGDERRRVEAKRLIEAAVTDGATIHISASAGQFERNTPGRSSLTGSQSDLRRIELVRPSVTIKSFKKRDPSPVLQRKPYQGSTPILPAISRPTQAMGEQLMQRVGVPSFTLSGVKRFGSMRGQELRDSISQIAAHYGVSDPLRGSQTSVNSTPGTSTLGRKEKGSQWEKDVDDVESCNRELGSINERLKTIDETSKAIEKKLENRDDGSISDEEEDILANTYIQLKNEKNSLVARQDYYNIIENIRDVIADINRLNGMLGEITKNTADGENFFKSSEEKAKTDRVMTEYMEAIEKKDRLVQQLFATESQQMEDEERMKSLTLERSSNFVRGNEEPLSASKRIMTWLRG